MNDQDIKLIGFNISNWFPDENEWNSLNEFLNDPIESDRIANFKRPSPTQKNQDGSTEWLTGKDNTSAKSSLAGRILMIEIVYNMFNLDNYNIIKFKRTELNKPYLYIDNNNDQQLFKQLPQFSFNLSHDSNWVVLLACKQYSNIGIDIMNCKIPRNQKKIDFFSNMKSCFTDNEWNVIKDDEKSEQEQVDLFFIHWCLKESFIKADGKGLEITLKSFEFKLDQLNQTAQITILNNKSNHINTSNKYQFTYFRPFKNDIDNNTYMCAICLDVTNNSNGDTTNNNNNNDNVITKDNLQIQVLNSDFKIKN